MHSLIWGYKVPATSPERLVQVAKERARYEAELNVYEERKAQGQILVKADEARDPAKERSSRKAERRRRRAVQKKAEERKRRDKVHRKLDRRNQRWEAAKERMEARVGSQVAFSELIKIGIEEGLSKEVAMRLANEILKG